MSDFSCSLTIYNLTGIELKYKDKGKEWGDWSGTGAKDPPKTIAAGDSGDFKLVDSAGPAGSEGWVRYTTPDGAEFKFTFNDPYGDTRNSASIISTAADNYSTYLVAKSGDGDFGNRNEVPADGHPLTVNYYIQAA